MELLLLFFIFINNIYPFNGGEPCPTNNPFKMVDDKCASFNEICLKKDNKQCNYLLDACKQCPGSNFTIPMLHNILIMVLKEVNAIKVILSKEIMQLRKNISFSLDKNNYNNYNNNTQNILNFNIIQRIILIVCVISLIFILIFIELQLKWFTKCWKRVTEKGCKKKYRKVKKDKKLSDRNIEDINYCLSLNKGSEVKGSENDQSNIDISNQSKDVIPNQTQMVFDQLKLFVSDELKQIIQYQLKLISDQFKESSLNTSDLFSRKIKFTITDSEESFDIVVRDNDNFVKIGRQICSKMFIAKENDYKRMKLKYNGTILDDNDYLLKQIGSNDDVINCDIDDAINVNDFVVINLIGIMKIPQMIKIQKNKTIIEIKKIIKTLTKKDFIIFQNKKLLSEDSNVESYDLTDGEWIRVIEKEQGELRIESIFDGSHSVFIKYTNDELVSSIKQKLSDKLISKNEDLILFYDKKYLADERFLCEIGIVSQCEIRYCHIKISQFFKIKSEAMAKGDACELFEAVEEWTKREVIVKKYLYVQQKDPFDWNNNKAFLRELTTFQLTKSHPRFVQLLNIFRDDQNIYISMEKISGLSIKKYIENNWTITEENIADWSRQILEGLKFLHNKKIIHRNIKPTSIMVNDYKTVKLSSFGLSKYLSGYDESYLIKGFLQSKSGTYRYMAPEICNNQPNGVKVDVWSLGATLIEIVTKNPPFHDKYENAAMIEISKKGIIPIQWPEDTSPNLKSFISSCVIMEPSERPTVEQLLEEEFLRY